MKKSGRARGRTPARRGQVARKPARPKKARAAKRSTARRTPPRRPGRAKVRSRVLRPWPGKEEPAAALPGAPKATAASSFPPEALAELKEHLDAVRFDLAGVGELAREVASSQRTVQRDAASGQEVGAKLAELTALTQALQDQLRRIEADRDALLKDREEVRGELGKLVDAWRGLQETVRALEAGAPAAAPTGFPAEPTAPDPFGASGAVNETLSRDLAALALRTESFDRRLTEVLARAGAAAGGGGGAPAALEGTVAALGVRLGVTSEEEFRDAMREHLKRLGIELTRWRERDADGSITGWPGEVEADVFVRQGLHTIVWFESQLIEDDVRKLKRIGDFYLDRTGISPRLVAVSPFAEEAAHRLAAELHVAVAADPEAVAADR